MNKKASELKEGESITYSLNHTPNIKVSFTKEYGNTTAYIFTNIGDPVKDGIYINLPTHTLDLLQKDIETQGRIEHTREQEMSQDIQRLREDLLTWQRKTTKAIVEAKRELETRIQQLEEKINTSQENTRE